MIAVALVGKLRSGEWALLNEPQRLDYPTTDYWVDTLTFDDHLKLEKVTVLENRMVVYRVIGTSTYFGVREV